MKAPTRTDEEWMKLALSLARSAAKLGEVPVGALIVKHNQLVSTGFNLRETSLNSIHHAEIIAIEKACCSIGNWRLNDCKIYVTLEPCLMCIGAIVNARLLHLIYATPDPKGGAAGSVFDFSCHEKLNHQFQVSKNVCAEEAKDQLTVFLKICD